MEAVKFQVETFRPVRARPWWSPPGEIRHARLTGLSKHRPGGGGGGGGGGGVSFLSLTSWARPSFSPTRTVNFVTRADLDAALANMQPGDLIKYNGSGVLTIQASSGYPYRLNGKNPASTVVIDLGNATNYWGTPTSGNYVKFSYTGSGSYSALDFSNCSNLRLYGGFFTTNDYGGTGIIASGPLNNILWYDCYVEHVGISGLALRDGPSGSNYIRNFTWRGEVNRFAMNPAHDSHGEKGTGSHCIIMHGASVEQSHLTLACYGHDSLAPGEVSAGQTWPEGGGGCVIEPGLNAGGPVNDLTCYALGVNLNMRPAGHGNPGDDGTIQAAGNVMNFWGNVPIQNCVVGWVEGRFITGCNIHGTGGTAWSNTTPPITVLHGRSDHVMQYTGGTQQNTNYATGYGIVYQDCQ